jgi:hypothetical protein
MFARIWSRLFPTIVACVLTGYSGGTSSAQQINGVPGSPESTIVIDGNVLPPPPQKFGGDIQRIGFASLAFNNLSGIGRSGTGTLSVDGVAVSTQSMERTIPLVLPWDESFDIGSDTGTPVDDQDYQVPFAFTGKIDKLTISVAPPVLTDEDKKKLMEAEHATQDAN